MLRRAESHPLERGPQIHQDHVLYILFRFLFKTKTLKQPLLPHAFFRSLYTDSTLMNM